MKIIYFASGGIAEPVLQILLESTHQVCCVVTVRDKRKGRHLKDSYTAIKQFALKQNISLCQPADFNDDKTSNILKSFGADLFIVFSFGKILPSKILSIPKLFSLNIHASLLPNYRGPAPIARALWNGETKTGITFIRMNEQVDRGDIIEKKELPIQPDDNALTLNQKLGKLAAESILDVIENISCGKVTFTPQPQPTIPYAHKIKKSDGEINWDKPALEISNQIRACYGWPGAFTHHHNKLIKIWAAKIIDSPRQTSSAPGTILQCNKEGILVSTQDGALLVNELQLASGKHLTAWQFLQGHPIKQGEVFT